MKILIVDDHALFREGLRLLIAQLEADAIITLAPSVEEAITQVINYSHDLILLDWNLNGITGEEALVTLQEINTAARIVVLSAERDINLIRRSIDLGASGFIHKDSSPETLIGALKSILGGEVYLPSDAFIRNNASAHSHNITRQVNEVFPDITPRQLAVLSAVVRGLPNKLIAREMSISEDTVKQHLTSIFRAMNVTNRTQAVYSLAQNRVSI